ncbi:CASP-like protein 3A1 [Senna tora]|uniref:CASP-like protein n=1 Tax=Senna tora TaxID=362788 RepID=A0A834WEH5_9FABA|nr:CASP-like protein 3A1 [Senna tora]
MANDRNLPEDTTVQMPAVKVTAAFESTTMSGPLVVGGHHRRGLDRRKAEVMQVALRLLSMLSSVIALSFMVTAEEASVLSVFGFDLPVYSKWSFSESFEYVRFSNSHSILLFLIAFDFDEIYLVGVSGAVVVHSLLQLLIGTSRLLRKSSVIPSRNYAWLVFAGDQAFAYALMSAGSAASGVTNLNHSGIRHTALPNFCKPLHKFCDHVAISIAFTFISFFWMATSTIHDVIWLIKH